MKKFLEIIFPIFLIGSVDLIDGNYAEVEITEYVDGKHETIRRVIPLEMFPCDIKEGNLFYFLYNDGVTEIRCGEPPA